jgi:hypothetical protein
VLLRRAAGQRQVETNGNLANIRIFLLVQTKIPPEFCSGGYFMHLRKTSSLQHQPVDVCHVFLFQHHEAA